MNSCQVRNAIDGRDKPSVSATQLKVGTWPSRALGLVGLLSVALLVSPSVSSEEGPDTTEPELITKYYDLGVLAGHPWLVHDFSPPEQRSLDAPNGAIHAGSVYQQSLKTDTAGGLGHPGRRLFEDIFEDIADSLDVGVRAEFDESNILSVEGREQDHAIAEQVLGFLKGIFAVRAEYQVYQPSQQDAQGLGQRVSIEAFNAMRSRATLVAHLSGAPGQIQVPVQSKGEDGSRPLYSWEEDKVPGEVADFEVAPIYSGSQLSFQHFPYPGEAGGVLYGEHIALETLPSRDRVIDVGEIVAPLRSSKSRNFLVRHGADEYPVINEDALGRTLIVVPTYTAPLNSQRLDLAGGKSLLAFNPSGFFRTGTVQPESDLLGVLYHKVSLEDQVQHELRAGAFADHFQRAPWFQDPGDEVFLVPADVLYELLFYPLKRDDVLDWDDWEIYLVGDPYLFATIRTDWLESEAGKDFLAMAEKLCLQEMTPLYPLEMSLYQATSDASELLAAAKGQASLSGSEGITRVHRSFYTVSERDLTSFADVTLHPLLETNNWVRDDLVESDLTYYKRSGDLLTFVTSASGSDYLSINAVWHHAEMRYPDGSSPLIEEGETDVNPVPFKNPAQSVTTLRNRFVLEQGRYHHAFIRTPDGGYMVMEVRWLADD